MMVSFDLSNASCSVSSQWNMLLGLSSSRKGNIVSAVLNAYRYDTWFTKPNHDLTFVRFCGVGKSAMALMYFLHGHTVSLVPAKSTSSLANMNFSGFRVIPCLPQVSNQLDAWKKLSSIVSDHRRVSSMHLVLFGMDEVISSYLLVYASPEAM